MINYDIIYLMYTKLKVKIFTLLRYLLNNMLCEIFRVILVDDRKNAEHTVFDLPVRSVKEILARHMILNEINCVSVSICRSLSRYNGNKPQIN